MLTAKILNNDATLNNFIEIGSLDFVPETETKLVIRLFNPQLNLRYIPENTATVKACIEKTDGTILEKTLTPLSDDRSILSTTLQESETSEIIGGNFTIEVDVLGDGTRIEKGLVSNGLRKMLVGGC